MLPFLVVPGGLPEGFDPPLGADRTLSFPSAEVFEHRRQWIDDWLQALSR